MDPNQTDPQEQSDLDLQYLLARHQTHFSRQQKETKFVVIVT